MKYIKYFKGDESMQYKVLQGQDKYMSDALKKLRNEVEIHCNSGWKLQGGVSITVTDYDYFYACQAIIKEN